MLSGNTNLTFILSDGTVTILCIFLLYRHHMELTKNGFAKFKTELGKNKKKYFDENKLRNFDEPEDGLDGLMQVNSILKLCNIHASFMYSSLKCMMNDRLKARPN